MCSTGGSEPDEGYSFLILSWIFKNRTLELEGLIVVPALMDPTELGAEPVSQSLWELHQYPHCSLILCFWPQTTICYLFFNLVAWTDANSHEGME